jgi:hypothetical protein
MYGFNIVNTESYLEKPCKILSNLLTLYYLENLLKILSIFFAITLFGKTL